jgi:phage/plasmid-like protein (TIGR03299 family)
MVAAVETMAYAGEVPWHGLGTKVPNDLSTDDFLKEAQLDWQVQKIPSFVNLSGEPKRTGSFSLVRSSDNKILAPHVGEGWNPVQNKEAFDFFSEYVEAGDMEMHTAGSLQDGKIVWALAKIKQGFELFKGDEVENYMLFSNPHKFGKAIDIRMTPIRVVCNNTLTLSLSQKSDKMVTLSHRKEFNPEMVKEQLGIAREKLENYKTMAEFLGSKRYTTERLVEYLETIYPSKIKKEDRDPKVPTTVNAKRAFELIETQPGANYAKGSWWQAFNAVTYSTDHLQGNSTDGRLSSAWYGRNRRLKLKALNSALEMAEAA